MTLLFIATWSGTSTGEIPVFGMAATRYVLAAFAGNTAIVSQFSGSTHIEAAE